MKTEFSSIENAVHSLYELGQVTVSLLATARNQFARTALVVALACLAGAATAGETVTYYYTDPNGTILAKADTAGNIISTSDYKPYGAQALGNPEPGPGYTGHVSDPDSGLVYMQARYYDPLVGRFLGVDSAPFKAGEVASAGRYTYANDNPVTNIDPDGRNCMTSSGTTRCVTAVYDVSFRAQPGFHDFTSTSENYHFYSVPVVTNEVNLNEAQAGLTRYPTPGWPLSATASGTKKTRHLA